MTYEQIVNYLNQAQVPHREQDGKVQVLDFSQVPWGMRGLFDAQGYIVADRPSTAILRLSDDLNPTLSGDLNLNSHTILGELRSDGLTIDGGLI